MHGHAYDVGYINGPNGKRLCTAHDVEFDPPHQCPKCRRAKPVASQGNPTMAPIISAAISEEVTMFESIAEEYADIAATVVGESAKVQALRERSRMLIHASNLRMERARAQETDRLKNRTPAAATMPDPRDAFGLVASDDLGTAAPDEIIVAGDN